jgi:hypothetical protein
MATADTTDNIAHWPLEGTSYDEALKRAPTWDAGEVARANAIPVHRQLAGSLNPPTEEERRSIEACRTMRAESRTWLHGHLEGAMLVLMCRDPERLLEEPQPIHPSMIKYFLFRPRGLVQLVHGANRRSLCDARIFAAASLKSKPPPEPLHVLAEVTNWPEGTRSETPSRKREKPLRHSTAKARTRAISDCTEYLVTVLQNRQDCRTVEEFQTYCKKQFKIPVRSFREAWRAALDRAPPEVKAARTAPGRRRR